MIKLETETLVLNEFSNKDLEFLVSMESDKDVMRFTGPGRALTRDESTVRLDKYISDYEKYTDYGVWAVSLKNTKKNIGWFMLKKTDLMYPEIGYMFVKDNWGKGYATELIEGVIKHLTKHPNIEGISARTDKQNIASIKVLENNGMELTQGPEHVDTTLSYFSINLHKVDIELI